MDAKSVEILHNQDLIRAVKYLYRQGRIEKDKDIVDTIKPYKDYKKNTVSGYITGKINASPEFRTKFEEAFNLKLSDFMNDDPITKSIINENSPEYLAGKLAGKDEVIAEKERLIQEVKASAEKAEKENDRLLTIIEKNLTVLLSATGRIDTNLKAAKDDLFEIESSQRAQHTVMMHSLERIEGEPGKLHKELSTLERASQSAVEQTGSLEDMGKKNKG